MLADKAAEFVVKNVELIKNKGTVKVVTLLRVIVYGLVILAAALTALLLVTIGVVRIWDVYIPLQPLGRRVWLGYVVLGGACFLAGSWLLASSRRSAR